MSLWQARRSTCSSSGVPFWICLVSLRLAVIHVWESYISLAQPGHRRAFALVWEQQWVKSSNSWFFCHNAQKLKLPWNASQHPDSKNKLLRWRVGRWHFCEVGEHQAFWQLMRIFSPPPSCVPLLAWWHNRDNVAHVSDLFTLKKHWLCPLS